MDKDILYLVYLVYAHYTLHAFHWAFNIYLLFSANADDMAPLFEKYGDIGDIYFPTERGSGRSRGFAFVRLV